MPEVTPPAPEPGTPTNPDAPAPADTPNQSIKDITFDGYTFKVDMDKVDDVENVDLLDQIENKQNLKAIVEFLDRLIGKDEYEKLKAYFVQKDGRFKLTKLGELYQAIFEQFDPKG